MCFTCHILLSNAAIPQWPVGSNVAFLTGRLGVSHIMHASRDDYLSQNDTSGPPGMVFEVLCVSRAPYCCQKNPFLCRRLRVIGCSSVAGWEHHTWCIHQERIICPEITHQGPQTWFSMFNVPYRPIQPLFLSGRLGVMGVPHWPVGSLPYKTGIGIELFGQMLHI